MADSPRGCGSPSVLRVLREFLHVFRSIHFVDGFSLHEVRGRSVLECRTVRGGADGPRAHRRWPVIEGAVLDAREHFSDSPPYLADGPPGGRGQFAWGFAVLLSPLLLEFRFRFGIIWGLFLGLVGPLLHRDLDKLVWRFLVVNLGHRPSSLFGAEFLLALIHWPPPLSGHLIGPSGIVA
jgi:hypothetical protein